MIYICIPALNEAQTVGVLLWRIRQVMAEFGRDYHLLVVDDGSTDATAEVLAPYTRVLPLTVVRHERNQGYAAAVETLAREAVARSTHPKRDSAVFLQADFTEPPEEIPALVRRIEGGADVVGSAVNTVEGEVTRGMRWSRAGLPWLLKRSAVPREITDPFSGFRAYRLQVLKRALADVDGRPLLSRSGWAANAELLVRVAPHVRRAEQAEVGLRYTRRERESRFRPWDAVREAWALARLAPGRSRLARPVEERDTQAEREVPAATPDRVSAAERRAARTAVPRTQPAAPPSTEAAAPEARPPREPRPRREKPPRPAPAADAAVVEDVPVTAPEVVDAAEPGDAVDAEAPRKPKRKPRRRKSARAREAAAGSTERSGDDSSGSDSTENPAGERPERAPQGMEAQAGESVVMDPASALNDGAAPEEGAAPARRRPRRPRRRKPAAAREGGEAAEGAPAPVPESEG